MDVAMMEKQGIEAAQRGDFALAAQHFDRVARAHLAAADHGKAFRVFTNLAMVRKLAGDPHGGLAAIDQALSLPVANEERRFALVTRGALFDALDDARAIAAWTDAAAHHEDPAGAAFCRAHAAGASLKHGDPQALDAARRALAEAVQAPPALVVGIVGAVGESAGRAGVPMLAQACLMMLSDIRTFTTSTTPFWELLVDRLEPAEPIVLMLTAFGMIASMTHQNAPDAAALASRARAVVQRVAQGRGGSIEDLIGTITQQFSNAQGEVDGSMLPLAPALRALVPADQWLIEI